MEATGVYHLDLAVALHNAQDIEVMVVNPKAAKHADAAMTWTKTDAVDAAVLAEYAQLVGSGFDRKMLIHGARAVLNKCSLKTDKLSLWLKELSSHAHPCKVIVALANKMERVAWVVMATGKAYQAA